jgi:hypothetical protein
VVAYFSAVGMNQLWNQRDGGEARIVAAIFRCNSQRDFDEDRNGTLLAVSTHCEI